jgi:hypothetical protein
MIKTKNYPKNKKKAGFWGIGKALGLKGIKNKIISSQYHNNSPQSHINSHQSHNNSSQSDNNILSQSNNPIIRLNNELNQLLQTYSSKFNSINYNNDEYSLSREYQKLINYYTNELSNNQNSTLYILKQKFAKIRRELNDEEMKKNNFIILKKLLLRANVLLKNYLEELEKNLSNLQFTIDYELNDIKEEMDRSCGSKKKKFFVGSSSSPSYNSSQRSRSRSRSSSRRTSSQRTPPQRSSSQRSRSRSRSSSRRTSLQRTPPQRSSSQRSRSRSGSSSQRSRSRSRSSSQRSHSHSRSSSQRSLSRSSSPSQISSLYNRSVSRSRTPITPITLITPGRTPSNLSSVSSELRLTPSSSPKNRSETPKTPGNNRYNDRYNDRYNGGKKFKK